MIGRLFSKFKNIFCKTFPSRFSRIAIVAVVILPLVYSALYLWAFWDPYTRVEDLPVAFVNQDKGDIKDGVYKNLGGDLEKDLREDHNVKWDFVSLDEANQGLQDKKYYSYIWVPEDFTHQILSVDGSDPQKARLILKTREASNVISARIVNRVGYEISEKLGHKITEEYFDNIFIESRNTADDIRKAADGARDLSKGLADAQQGSLDLENGIDDASKGSTDLRNGLFDAYDGGDKIKAGLDSAYDGSNDLYNGLSTLAGGIHSLSTNLASAYAGDQSISTGLTTVKQSASDILAGMQQVAAGSSQVTDGLTQGQAGISSLNDGLTSAQSNMTALQQAAAGAAQLGGGINSQVQAMGGTVTQMGSSLNNLLISHPELADDADFQSLQADLGSMQTQQSGIGQTAGQLNAVLGGLQNGLSALATGINTMAAGASQINTSMPALSAGSEQVTSNLGILSAGQSQLVDGLGSLLTGQNTITAGLEQLNAGAQQLDSGAASALDGSKRLRAGLASLNDGGQTLLEGLWNLRDGSVKLDDGLNELNSGSVELADGLADASSGSSELYQKLNDGYIKSKDEVDKQKTDKEKPVMADPVEFKEEMVDPVKTYGTGFTPYFIPLSLWVGAMAIFLVIPSLSNEEARKFHFTGLLREVGQRYLMLAGVGVLQAVVLCTILVKVLGLEANHMGTFYLFTILLALLSIAIFQFLTFLFGLAGDFVGVILLMMQLTSSGGSYPKETLPQFFIMIGPYLPMTYAVSAFRDIISGNQIDVSGIFYGFSLAIIILLTLTVTLKWILSGGLSTLKEIFVREEPLNNDEDDNSEEVFSPRRLKRLNRGSIAGLKLSRSLNVATFKQHSGKLKEIRSDGLQRINDGKTKLRSELHQKADAWRELHHRRE